MLDELERLARELREELEQAGTDLGALDALRVSALGKRGRLTGLMKQLAMLPGADRPAAGKAINELKRQFSAELDAAISEARRSGRAARVSAERDDVTLPAARPWNGSLHLVTRTRRELESIFRSLGYSVEAGPEVEDDFHNFRALNMPEDHPARDAQDTFYLEGDLLLRTHTSPVQIRAMERRQPPIRMVCPGRVYRRDYDATHLPMFHQLEALVVDETITMADLKGTMEVVWRRFFGEDVKTRLRPGYFPFVEPGCEYDISCQVCAGTGCRVCKQTGWIELGGAGMVHPAVFEAVGVDAERYTGFAFGLGIDRIAMMKHGVDDLRMMLDNDVRFLEQFPV